MKKKQDREAGLTQLKGELKQEQFQRIYILHGEETYLRDYYFQQLKEKILPAGTETFNFHEFQGKELSLTALEEAMDSFPMMAERSLIVVHDWEMFKLAEGPRKKFMELLEDVPEYCTLIFYFDIIPYSPDGRTKLAISLGKLALIVEFPFQSEEKLVKWIANQRFPIMGKRISPELAKELIFYCGESMTNLVGEIDKIGAYASGEEISKEDMEAVATPHINAIVFAMTDAMAEQNYDKAMEILGQLFQMEGKSKGSKMEKELGILGAMSRQIRQLYQIKVSQGKNESYIASLLGVQSFIARRLMGNARKFSLAWCRRGVILCGDTDRAMKSSKESGEALLTQLLLNLALDKG